MEQAYTGQLWHPARWRTADGYMPFRLFCAYEHRLEVARAEYRLDTSLGIAHALGQKKDEPPSAPLQRDLELAGLALPRHAT